MTAASLCFFMTRTVIGDLYQVNRCDAGSWMVMTIAEFFMIRPHGPNCWKGLGAFKLLVRRNPLSFCSNFEAGVFFSGLGLPSKTSSFPDPPPPSLSQPPGSERPWRANFCARARVDSSILSWTSGSQPSVAGLSPSVAVCRNVSFYFLHCWCCWLSSVLTSVFFRIFKRRAGLGCDETFNIKPQGGFFY